MGTATAITSRSFRYSEVQTAWLSLDTMDFIPDGDISADDYLNSYGDFLEYQGAGATGCFNASIHLPQKARMKAVAYFYKSDDSNDPEWFGEIVRKRWSDLDAKFFATADFDDDSNLYERFTARVPDNRSEVDNKKFAYAIYVCLDPDTRFYGARIRYTYRTAGA